MLRSGNLQVSTHGHGAVSPSLQGLAMISEDEKLHNHDGIPDIAIDDSFLTSDSQQPTLVERKPLKLETNRVQKLSTVTCETLCGARIAVYQHPKTSSSDKKKTATIGGVFRIGDRRFALTVAHVFFDFETNVGAFPHAGTSEAVAAPKIADVYEVVVESYWPNKADPGLYSKPTNVSIGLVAPSVRRRRQGIDAVALPEVIWDDELDWALIELTDTACWQPNILCLSPSLDLELNPPSYDQTPPTGDVIIAAGVSGAVTGIGSGLMEKIKVPGSQCDLPAWTIEDSDLVPGDAGALVLCPKTGTIYGIVMVHDPRLRRTYIVPSPAIFGCILSCCKEGIPSLNGMFSVCNQTSPASTLVDEPMSDEYLRTPVTRSAQTDVKNIFMSTLKGFSLQNFSGHRFVRRSELVKWLLASRRDGIPPIDFMLDHTYPRNTMIPVKSEQISSGDQAAIVVFSLLFELGHGSLIHHFMRYGLTDNRLPFDLVQIKEAVLRAEISESDQVAQEIFDSQWSYCPMTFDLEMERDIPAHIVIPVHQRRQINSKGDNATIWQVTVLEEYVGKRLQTASIRARFNESSDKLGHRYHFALKSFTKGQSAHYETEVNAYKALHTVPGMVAYLGNFHHVSSSPSPRMCFACEDRKSDTKPVETNNIVLEYGDYDLDEYFANTPPPVLPIQVAQFWQDLAGVSEAISEIHLFSTRRAGVKQDFSGWHADIQPDNILNVKGIFKLADPGFARFESSDKKTTLLIGGTKTYGSPEAHLTQRTDRPVSQAIDIWSLGCVLSVAATWVILGWSGVNQYQQLRVEALKRLGGLTPHQIRLKSRSRSRSTGRASGPSVNSGRNRSGSFQGAKPRQVPEGDCFHDGENVLDEIRHWHQFLRTVVRKSDEVSIQVLDLVDTKMLMANPEERIHATDLYKQMKAMVRNNISDYVTISDVVSQILLKTDDNKSPTTTPRISAATTSSTNGPLSPTLKTSQQSLSLLVPHVPMTSAVTVDSSSARSDKSQAVPPNGLLPMPPLRNSVKSEDTRRSTTDGMDIPARSQNDSASLRSRSTRKMTIAEARAEVDRRKKVFSRKRKDPFLVEHLEHREVEFLVDNGDTMAKHWREVTELVDILCSMVAEIHCDGLDLTFTAGSTKLRPKSKSNVKAIRTAVDKACPQSGVGAIRTEMSSALDRVLGEYSAQVKNAKPPSAKEIKSSSSATSVPFPRNYTLVVLTDGIWRGTGDPQAVEDTIIRRIHDIRRHVKKIRHEHGYGNGDNNNIGGLTMAVNSSSSNRDRHVTIQFVQFGQDAEATSRLEALDRGLVDYEIPDIIDTEPAKDGNVLKMLLGSVCADLDYAE